MRNPRGISGVVIAVLLTVIGILAVLMFWGMFSGMFNPQPKVIIEKASITNITKPGGQQKEYDLSITVREVGGASTLITKAEIVGEKNDIKFDGDTTLQPGQSKTLTKKIDNVNLKPGVTYYIAVYYQKGNGDERSELYPVTVR